MRRRPSFVYRGQFYSQFLSGMHLLARHGLIDFCRVAWVERNGRRVLRMVNALEPIDLEQVRARQGRPDAHM